VPVDYIKIDGQFVRQIDTDEVDRAMVRCINEMVKIVGKQTIAEYVDSAHPGAAARKRIRFRARLPCRPTLPGAGVAGDECAIAPARVVSVHSHHAVAAGRFGLIQGIVQVGRAAQQRLLLAVTGDLRMYDPEQQQARHPAHHTEHGPGAAAWRRPGWGGQKIKASVFSNLLTSTLSRRVGGAKWDSSDAV
jgi:hypothetical protein